MLERILEGQAQIIQALPFIKFAIKQVFKPPTPSNASRGSNKSFRNQLLKFYGLKPQGNDMVNANDDDWQLQSTGDLQLSMCADSLHGAGTGVPRAMDMCWTFVGTSA